MIIDILLCCVQIRYGDWDALELCSNSTHILGGRPFCALALCSNATYTTTYKLQGAMKLCDFILLELLINLTY